MFQFLAGSLRSAESPNTEWRGCEECIVVDANARSSSHITEKQPRVPANRNEIDSQNQFALLNMQKITSYRLRAKFGQQHTGSTEEHLIVISRRKKNHSGKLNEICVCLFFRVKMSCVLQQLYQ